MNFNWFNENIYPNVEEEHQHSVGNHGHIKCHIVLKPAAEGGKGWETCRETMKTLQDVSPHLYTLIVQFFVTSLEKKIKLGKKYTLSNKTV